MERLDQMSFIALNSNSWPIQSGQGEKARFSPVYLCLHSSQQQVFTEYQQCARLYDKKHWQSSGELGKSSVEKKKAPKDIVTCQSLGSVSIALHGKRTNVVLVGGEGLCRRD